MKQRVGFVSNSSSSSFIVCSKEPITAELMMEIMGFRPDSYYKNIVASFVRDCGFYVKFSSLREYIEYMQIEGYFNATEDFDKALEEFKDGMKNEWSHNKLIDAAFQQGMLMYETSVCDESDDFIERLIRREGLNVTTDKYITWVEE